jgi:hypothetical protein
MKIAALVAGLGALGICAGASLRAARRRDPANRQPKARPQRAGAGHSKEQLGRAVTWLAQHQDASTGQWPASSLNKKRDPASDIGKFMSDAATAYAVLALTAGIRD